MVADCRCTALPSSSPRTPHNHAGTRPALSVTVCYQALPLTTIFMWLCGISPLAGPPYAGATECIHMRTPIGARNTGSSGRQSNRDVHRRLSPRQLGRACHPSRPPRAVPLAACGSRRDCRRPGGVAARDSDRRSIRPSTCLNHLGRLRLALSGALTTVPSSLCSRSCPTSTACVLVANPSRGLRRRA